MTRPAAETITVLRVRGRRLAKLIRADGTISDYDAGYRFDLIACPVADLDALHRLLDRLLHRPDCAVVRGVPIDPERCTGVRRLAHADPSTGDQPTLRDVPHQWAALDLDAVERPGSVPAADLPACADCAVRRLPDAFHGVRGIIQASGSHGIKPGVRLRLWYWLSRPTTGSELTRWLRLAPVDPSVFRTVQVIYTAAPVFALGSSDHLRQRMVTLPGDAVVPVPPPAALAPPPPRPPAPMPKTTDAGAGSYALNALTNAASRVQGAGVGKRHDTILREARSLARLISGGLLTRSDVIKTLRDAGVNAGKPEGEIDSVIEWAIDHPSGTALPEDVAR
jgi:hypothetical protein